MREKGSCGRRCAALSANCVAQAPVKYEPTIESLDKHPLPDWYAGAKLGIFIHWGLYSVPGWAPLNHPDHDFSSNDYIKYDPYAEWYLNTVRIPGSPTEAYDREHYGPHHDYYQFAETFNKESKKWNPDSGRRRFARRGEVCGADQQASRRVYAVAEHDAESEPDAADE
jgi:alpha-L-fucosidase